MNGNIIAAVKELRFRRKKHITNYPTLAIKYYLTEVGFDINDLNAMVFYDKPF